jgi:hypothetical protein
MTHQRSDVLMERGSFVFSGIKGKIPISEYDANEV